VVLLLEVVEEELELLLLLIEALFLCVDIWL